MDKKCCEVCGKEFGDPAIIGIRIGYGSGLGMIAPADNPIISDNLDNLKKQFGPYELRMYSICWECWLRAMGVPEPKKGA